jgi:hypothetical protein
MTYAAVNRATTAVWIAEEASDDHRSVIDWLNDNTPPHLDFYLACVRAFRIGSSPVAPQLEMFVGLILKSRCRGAKWRHRTRDSRVAPTAWSEVHAYIAAHNPPFRLQAPGTKHWSSETLGDLVSPHDVLIRNALA